MKSIAVKSVVLFILFFCGFNLSFSQLISNQCCGIDITGFTKIQSNEYSVANSEGDDGSFPQSAPLPLNFDFKFFGQTLTNLYININGNVTFNESDETFSSEDLGTYSKKMIAPFWSDIDLGGAFLNGGIYYKFESLHAHSRQSRKRFARSCKDNGDDFVRNQISYACC